MGHGQGKNLSIALSEHAFAGIATLVKVENWKKVNAILLGLYLQTFALHDAATGEYLVEVTSQAGEYFLPGGLYYNVYQLQLFWMWDCNITF